MVNMPALLLFEGKTENRDNMSYNYNGISDSSFGSSMAMETGKKCKQNAE